MSSQGSSSVRIFSRAAFAPLVGDPLSRDVSTPNASSTESAPEVASRPANKRAIEPVRETTSASGRIREEEEEDEVVVCCKDLQFTLTVEDYVQIARQYDLEMVAPYKLERPYTHLDGYVTVSETYLKFGVRFPCTLFSSRSLSISGSPCSK